MHARATLALLPALIVAAGLAGAAAAGRSGASHTGGTSEAGNRKVGFELKETREELQLDYTVEASDSNGGGRVSVTFTLADEGRIKPITSVDFAVPSKDGSGYYDVLVTLSPFEREGKKVYVMQLTRDLAERGEMHLKTKTMDGKGMLNWGYHRVVLEKVAKAVKKAGEPELKKN